MKLLIWALLALVVGTSARTTNRQPASPLRAQSFTSLSDRDAKRKAMEHPAFASAGQRAGVEIWRIENFEPVPVPQSDFGKFYKGDSYIVLKTTADKRNNLSWDIHYWLGAQTTQDEAGAAAILTVGLDDKFNGAPVQHREVQGHESSQFLGYFQPAIRYLDGGHASGFSHVVTNAGAEKRLFQIKGKRNVRVRQVDPLISSMNKGDCFILDVDHDIYVYVGQGAKPVERLKAISVANQIRDQDHNGRGRVEIIDSASSETDVQRFFTALGSGSRDLVPEASAGGDDQTFERSEEQTVTLSEISDSTGTLKVTPLTRPYRQDQLKPQECYILDTVSGSIYVWVGKQATQREKTEAMAKAQQYLTAKNYPSWVHVSRVPQGTEPAAFKQYFTTWQDVGMSRTRLVRSLSDDEFYDSDPEVSSKRARVIGKTGAARGFMPDNGDGQYVVYRIENLDLVQLYDSDNTQSEPGKRFGEFYQGDSYVIKYSYTKDDKTEYIIYFWLGKDSTLDEQTAAAANSVVLDRELDGAATVVRVPQGEEPKHFLKIFKGGLITLLGGKASGFRNSNQRDSYDNDGIRLFKIYGTTAGEDMRAEQVAEVSGSLHSDDVFIFQTNDKNYIWHGRDSSDVEKEEALKFASRLLGDGASYEIIEQGAEPDDFWTYLGGAPEVVTEGRWRSKLGKRIGVEPRLLEATMNFQNVVFFEEIGNFQQKDLQEDDVYVMDTGDEVYVWVGSDTIQRMRKAANIIGEAYLRRTGRSSSSAVLITIKQGLEPPLFKNLFEEWDDQMWQKRKEDTTLDNEI